MSKNKEYWVKIDSDVMIGILAGMNIIYSRDAPVVKVVDDMKGGDLVYWVEDCSCKLSKSYLHPLSFVEALSLDMEHNAKWREICADCLNRELMDKKDDVLKKLFEEYIHTDKEDKSKTNKNEDMESIIDLFRKQSELFDKFTEAIRNFDFEQVKEGVNLPDEIDLYNFFEKYKGVAKGIMTDRSYSKLCGYYAYFMTKNFEIENLSEYLSVYKSTATVNYYIGNNRYYAIRFKDRGVFLVSEKRYQELKANKGL